MASVDRSDSKPLYCFEGELRQILANLVGNAFDAVRTGGHLRLRAREVTDWKTNDHGIRITVADNGIGMNADTQSRICEPFFSTKGIGGTGLGLWITQDLIEKNGGTIRVWSNDAAGKSGTVFVLFFRQ